MTNLPSSESEFKSKAGIKRILTALCYSWQGLRQAWKSEHAFRQELFLCGPGILIALCLPVQLLEKILLIIVCILVLVVELINSAIEAVVDRISLECHPLSKNAKDFGSAAVMLTVLMASLVWITILFQHFF